MIYSPEDNKEVTGIYIIVNGLQKIVTGVYKGVRAIWLSVRSCFGTGTWIESKPWLDNDIWR